MNAAAALILALFVAGRCLVPMDETDLFYNLRLGELILTTHAVPRTNLFSFVAGDTPDPNLAWLFQLVLALAHRAAGIPGTVVLKTAFVVACFLLLLRVAVRRGAHPAVAAAVLALAAWAAEPRFVERPHLVTFVGLALLLLALERAEARRPRLLFASIPLGLLWANGNSCFFLAPSVLLLYAAGALVDLAAARALTAAARPAPPAVEPAWLRVCARRAALVALALLPLLFATPSGARWFGYVVNHFRMPSLRPLQEYRQAEWPTDGPYLFLLLAVVAVTVGARRAQPSAARHLLPVLALAVLGSRRIRFVAEFALLAGPYVAARATPLVRSLALHLRGAGSGRGAATATLLALLALAVGPRLAAARRGAPLLDLNIEPDLVPGEAIAWVDAHRLRERMYNDLEVGSYLIWQGWPRHPVFQDPRINGYPDWLHAILRRGDLSRAEWQALMDRFDVRSALITFPDVNPRAALFDPWLWALVYRGDDALVFVRRVASRDALAAAEEIPLTFAFQPEVGVRALPLATRPPRSPLPDCEWARRLAAQWAAAGATDRAIEALQSALGGVPGCLSPGAEASARALLRALAGADAPGGSDHAGPRPDGPARAPSRSPL